MEVTNIEIIAGATPTLRFSLTVPQSVEGWTTMLYFMDPRTGNNVLTANGETHDAVAGVFDVFLSANNTLELTNANNKPRKLDYSFWRTDTDVEEPLASGEAAIKVVKRV